MITNIELSAAEGKAVAEARTLLGDNLSEFLLSGLGESDISHRRSFTAVGKQRHGNEIIYHFEMINDSELGLPMGRDPIVLATLLDDLWERQPLDSTILFRRSDILEKLKWNDDVESQSLIKQALERYALTAYCLVAPTIPENDSLDRSIVSIGRLLVGYEMASTVYPLKRGWQLEYQPSPIEFARAHFLPGLIHDVISERKYFLGIDFQGLRTIGGYSAETP